MGRVAAKGDGLAVWWPLRCESQREDVDRQSLPRVESLVIRRSWQGGAPKLWLEILRKR